MSSDCVYKAVILIAGPQKGTRFRPLSLDVPKPLFPVAGIPMIEHHIEAISKVSKKFKEILILGGYPKGEMDEFIRQMNKNYEVPVSYLQEYTALGTAGGIFHFRDRIRKGNPDSFVVINGDVCADFPFENLIKFHEKHSTLCTIMGTEATRQQSLNYGCLVENKDNHSLVHYVEKPNTYVSSLINCGVYVFSQDIFQLLQQVYHNKQSNNGIDIESFQNDIDECIWIERDIIPKLCNENKCNVFQTRNWWSQMKTAGSVIYANRHYLELYHSISPKRLAVKNEAQIIGNVFIHPSASIDPTAVIGPNVSIGENVIIGCGSRIKESIILSNSKVGHHSLIMYTVMGINTRVGDWTRVEGTPDDPNPNKPFAKMENHPLFNEHGKLNPSITIIGCHVDIPSEIIVLNAIVLPNKQIDHSFKNEIVL